MRIPSLLKKQHVEPSATILLSAATATDFLQSLVVVVGLVLIEMRALLCLALPPPPRLRVVLWRARMSKKDEGKLKSWL